MTDEYIIKHKSLEINSELLKKLQQQQANKT